MRLSEIAAQPKPMKLSEVMASASEPIQPKPLKLSDVASAPTPQDRQYPKPTLYPELYPPTEMSIDTALQPSTILQQPAMQPMPDFRMRGTVLPSNIKPGTSAINTPPVYMGKPTPILEKAVKGLGQGVAGTIESYGGLARVAGADKLADSINDYAKDMKGLYDIPDADFGYNLMSGVSSMAQFFVPGIGIARGAAALAAAPKVAKLLMVSVPVALESMQEAGSAANRVFEKTGDRKKAQEAAVVSFTSNVPLIAVTNKLGIFGDKGNKATQILASMLMEGGQEASQEAVGSLATREPLNPKAMGESGLIGAITGGGVKAVSSAVEGFKRVPEIKADHKIVAINTEGIPIVDMNPQPQAGPAPETQKLGVETVNAESGHTSGARTLDIGAEAPITPMPPQEATPAPTPIQQAEPAQIAPVTPKAVEAPITPETTPINIDTIKPEPIAPATEKASLNQLFEDVVNPSKKWYDEAMKFDNKEDYINSKAHGVTILKSGESAKVESKEYISIVSRSAKEKGKFQVTLLNKENVPLGDWQENTFGKAIETAIRETNPTTKEHLQLSIKHGFLKESELTTTEKEILNGFTKDQHEQIWNKAHGITEKPAPKQPKTVKPAGGVVLPNEEIKVLRNNPDNYVEGTSEHSIKIADEIIEKYSKNIQSGLPIKEQYQGIDIQVKPEFKSKKDTKWVISADGNNGKFYMEYKKLPEKSITTKPAEATTPKVDESKIKQIIENSGGQYIGLQKQTEGNPDLVAFNKTGAKKTLTLSVDNVTPENVKKRIRGTSLIDTKNVSPASLYLKPKINETTDKLNSILRESKNIDDAQKRIKKELDLDIPMADLKRVESQIRGGAIGDISETIVNDLYNRIKPKVSPEELPDYDLSKVVDQSTQDITDSISFWDNAGEKIKINTFELKQWIKKFHLVQNYLYNDAEGKPVAEGKTDADMQMTKKSTQIANLKYLINKADNKQAIANLLVKADRAERAGESAVNIDSIIESNIKSGTMTQNDANAIKSVQALNKIIKDQIVREIIGNRELLETLAKDENIDLSKIKNNVVRIKSDGIRYNVTYENSKGKTIERIGITEGQLNYINKRSKNVKIDSQSERLKVGVYDVNTAKTEYRTVNTNDYLKTSKEILGEEITKAIEKLLPYKNYIPHNRNEGTHWVNVYETTAEGRDLVYSTRVPSEIIANKMAESIRKESPGTMDVEVKAHDFKMKDTASFGSLVDITGYLEDRGIDPNSETAQRIINSYRSNSRLLSSLIHAKNIAGYRVDYNGIVDGLLSKAHSAVRRDYRANINDLKSLLKDITDTETHNISKKYIELLSGYDSKNKALDVVKSMGYFWLLANKTGYIIQNTTEPFWYWSRMAGKIKNSGKYVMPLEKEYVELLDRAQDEGIIKAVFNEQMAGQGIIDKISFAGKASESFSSKIIFDMALRLARDNNLHGDEAYRFAYQQLSNVGKPDYSTWNIPVHLLEKEAGYTSRYGMQLMRFMIDFVDKLSFGGIKGGWDNRTRTMLVWALLAGIGTMPLGRMLLKKLGLVNDKKNPRNMNLGERFLLNGIPGAMGISSAFLAPGSAKGIGEIGALGKGVYLLAGQYGRIRQDLNKYGALGLIGDLPLAGLQYPISGYVKSQQGIKEGNKVVYRPKGIEKTILTTGLQPFGLGEFYNRKYGSK